MPGGIRKQGKDSKRCLERSLKSVPKGIVVTGCGPAIYRQADRVGRGVVKPSRRSPFQKLGDAVDLVVMLPIGKCEQLKQKAIKPIGISRQMHLAGLDLRSLGLHALLLAAFGLDPDGARHAWRQVFPQILQQSKARAFFLNKDDRVPVPLRQAGDLTAQFGVGETSTKYVDQIEIGSSYASGCAK